MGENGSNNDWPPRLTDQSSLALDERPLKIRKTTNLDEGLITEKLTFKRYIQVPKLTPLKHLGTPTPVT